MADLRHVVLDDNKELIVYIHGRSPYIIEVSLVLMLPIYEGMPGGPLSFYQPYQMAC